MTERDPKVPGERVLDVDRVLLPQGFVDTEQVLELLPGLGRDIRVQRVEFADIARLSVDDEEH